MPRLITTESFDGQRVPHQLGYANTVQSGTGSIFEEVFWTRMANNFFPRQDVQVARVAALPFART